MTQCRIETDFEDSPMEDFPLEPQITSRRESPQCPVSNDRTSIWKSPRSASPWWTVHLDFQSLDEEFNGTVADADWICARMLPSRSQLVTLKRILRTPGRTAVLRRRNNAADTEYEPLPARLNPPSCILNEASSTDTHSCALAPEVLMADTPSWVVSNAID